MMQIPVGELRQALESVAPVVARRATLPITTHVLIGQGCVEVNNLEQAVRHRLPQAEGAPFAVPHRTLTEVLKATPGHHIATLDHQDSTLAIAAGRLRASLHVAAAADWPPFPSLTDPRGNLSLDGNALIEGLTKVSRCAAKDGSRPVLNAVCLTLGDIPEACAADGFRLAVLPLDLRLHRGGGEEPERLVLPLATAGMLAKLWRRTAPSPSIGLGDGLARLITSRQQLRMCWNDHQVSFAFGDVEFVTQRVQGEFPRYHQLVPQATDHTLHFLAPDLARALREIDPIAHDGSSIVRLRWGGDVPEGMLDLSAHNSDLGDVQSQMRADIEGGHGMIAFNIAYLREYVGGRDGMVTLQTSSPSAPGVFTAGDGATFVIMPMFVSWSEADGDSPNEDASTETSPAEQKEPAGAAAAGEPTEVDRDGPKRRRVRRQR